MPRKTSRLFLTPKYRKFLYVIGSLLGLFVLFNYVILPAYVFHAGTLKVPQVSGLLLDSAKKVLQAADLTPIEADTRPDLHMPAGTVVSQNPPAAAVVKPGRRVYLTLSGGELLVTVPGIRGLSTRDARFTLERYGLQMGAVHYATSENYPENTVIEQTIPANAKVPRGTAVGILVSRGMMIDDVAVPEVIGKTVREAERLLAQKGLKLGNITYQISEDLLPNTVVDQFPRPGDSVQRGKAVDLFVVKIGKIKDEIKQR